MRLTLYFDQEYALNRGELCAAIGLPPQNLAPVLRGERNLTIAQAKQLEDIAGILIRWWAEKAAA